MSGHTAQRLFSSLFDYLVPLWTSRLLGVRIPSAFLRLLDARCGAAREGASCDMAVTEAYRIRARPRDGQRSSTERLDITHTPRDTLAGGIQIPTLGKAGPKGSCSTAPPEWRKATSTDMANFRTVYGACLRRAWWGAARL